MSERNLHPLILYGIFTQMIRQIENVGFFAVAPIVRSLTRRHNTRRAS